MNIEAQLLNKCYGSKHVLKDISLTLAKNKIYGLLGRNGAGKTTLMHCSRAYSSYDRRGKSGQSISI